jgi:O-antigen/teichoic acid export membrane protein
LLGGAVLAPLIIVTGLLIPLQAVSSIPTSLMRRNLDMKNMQLTYMGGYLFAYALVGLPLAWAGAGPWSLIAAFAVHALINLVAGHIVVRHTLRPRLRGDSALRRFGLQVTGTNGINWAIENVDRLMVTRFWGTAALGEYTAAFTLSRAPVGLLFGSIQSVALASASRMQADHVRLARGYLAALGLVTLIAAPLFALLAMHAGAVVRLLYGDRWLGAIPLFAAFCAGLPFFVVQSITGPFLWAMDAVRQELVVQFVGALLLLAGFVALTGFPLAQAAWLVPVIYFLRAAGVYLALARMLQLPLRRAARAVRGGFMLSVTSVLASGALASWLAPLWAFAASLMLVVSLAAFAVRSWPRLLLSPELIEFLHNRAPDSALIRYALRWLNLPTERPR